ncbi:hypothetical protein CSUB01_01822 [Colletotrichum sublineola]|uniref:Uncharacterized protein n=1 Tax=Colletotrichum sublineola TaxID=1173701 RepID=A0A066WWI3_COLSU|nr:hypothetical protein CSUB01_01822 [Colletotrichum sublineola]
MSIQGEISAEDFRLEWVAQRTVEDVSTPARQTSLSNERPIFDFRLTACSCRAAVARSPSPVLPPQTLTQLGLCRHLLASRDVQNECLSVRREDSMRQKLSRPYNGRLYMCAQSAFSSSAATAAATAAAATAAAAAAAEM